LTFQARQKLPEALSNFEQALKEFEALDDRDEVANALASIGSIQYDQGNYEAASKTLQRLPSLRSDSGNLLQVQARARYSNALIATSWAWFVAGTPAVVVGRWEVDDSSATAFSSELHRNLRRSNDYSEALRRSVLKLRHSKTAGPYDWSGFMVMGRP
jgi:tetratricopeptide (TPR) repeat protein